MPWGAADEGSPEHVQEFDAMNPSTSTADPLIVAGRRFDSRLLVGTGKYESLEQTQAAIEASGAEIVTVAIRRTNIGQDPDGRTSWIISRPTGTPSSRTRPGATTPPPRCAPAGSPASSSTGPAS